MEKIMKTRRIVIAVLSIIAVAVIGVGAFLFMRPRQEQPQPQLQTQHTTTPSEATTPPTTVPTQSAKPEHQHKYTTEKKAPTCTKEGYTLYTCSCGDTYRSDEKKATGHSWSSWEETKKATTTAAGKKTRTCSVCGKKQTEATPKLSVASHTHKYTSKVVEATCTKEGYTRYTCSCGKTYDETIPVRSHLYGNWKVTAQATTTSEGKKEATCERCGHTKTKTIDKLTAEEAETYEKYIDSRVTIKKLPDGAVDYSYKDVSLTDTRSWGDPPAIRITSKGGFSVTYLKKNGNKVKVTLDPVDGYVRWMVIQSDGSYSLSLVGDFDD